MESQFQNSLQINMKSNKKVPELCVPAGNLNILKYAIAYGADAAYIGGQKFNLRSFSCNFDIKDLKEAVKYAHLNKVKIYLTLNAIISESEINEFKEYVKSLKSIPFDGIILSDPGVLKVVKSIIPDVKIHISTQTSTSNSFAVDFWESVGASRVTLARELSYDEIKEIVKRSKIEIEVFIHGALCISYSGRCMLSKYLSGPDANKGQCSHTCRWKYYIMEEKRPNMFFPIEQDKRGTYIYNSRDLCLLENLDLIVDSGVDSLKIEGRNKTENYVSLTTWVYKKALDLIANGEFTQAEKTRLLNELDKSTHRVFTKGFMFLDGKTNKELVDNDCVGYIKKYIFAGSIEGYSKRYKSSIIKARNQFKVGDVLDILQPKKEPIEFKLKKMINFKTHKLTDVANTNDFVIIEDIGNIDKYSIIRAKR